MCVCSIDVALLKDGEVGLKAASWTHMLQRIHDLRIGAILLQSTGSRFHDDIDVEQEFMSKFVWFCCFTYTTHSLN